MPQAPQNVPTENEALASIFEERAEHLNRFELDNWSAETPRDREVLAKLKGPGAKLLVGPRGSGKSTFLRKAYFSLLGSDSVLPAYVNFARSLALEPLFHRQANALQVFRQWILFKIVGGLRRAYEESEQPAPNDLTEQADIAENFIRQLETGTSAELPSQLLAPSQLLLRLEQWTVQSGHKRTVLLLDDAAHAFSPEQQREFFEIFRALRSRVVAAKAAVYPGITSYSPNFHVGHEAELVEAWYQPEGDDYLGLMRTIVQKRLTPALLARLEGRNELVDYLAFASFGLPRGFLTMLSQLLGVEEEDEAGRTRPTRKAADTAVSAHSEIVLGIFTSLADKLPRFKNFVDVGSEIIRNLVQQVRSFNYTSERAEKATAVALKTPFSPELDRILALMEYAGVVRKLDTISRGKMGVFQRYAVHYALLLKENALSLGASYGLSAVITAFQHKSRHALAYARETIVLNDVDRERCTLDLPPCQKCGAARISEEAKFCMNCGKQLIDSSIYDELLQAPISKLPLTSRKINDLIEQTTLRTVQDILLDDEMKQVRSVKYIGEVWGARIKNAAEEFVSV